jgi:hypothetical protein
VIGAHVFKKAGALDAALQKPLAAVEQQLLVPLAKVGTVIRGEVLPATATARFHAVHLEWDRPAGEAGGDGISPQV